MPRGSRRFAAALLQKPLYPPVLERMKRDHRQPTTVHQQLLGRDEPAIELTKLVIDGDTESLEGPSCRVLSRLKFWHGGTASPAHPTYDRTCRNRACRSAKI